MNIKITKTLICIISILLGINAYSQHDYREIEYYRGPDTKKLIDTCKYTVTYKFKFVRDTIKKQPYFDRQILEIGNKYSHYGSIYADQLDSIWYNYNKNTKATRPNKDHTNGINREKELGLKANEKASYEDFYTNYPKKGNMRVSTAIYQNEYIYDEPLSKFEWKIQTDTMTVLGYKCIKAITTFRGRDYEVWFTPLIPIRRGPWKFNGLFGLILKAVDTKGYFEWMAIGIEKNKDRYIYIHDLQKTKVQVINRNEVQKLQRKLWEDPIGLKLLQGQDFKVIINGKIVKPRSGIYKDEYIPPLELE
ncbi:MAG: GLPGLI family protein [Prevotellaceae bacterium]|nr:GLPGLI family protein [Prevotellaceae bacterium]